MRAPLRSVAKLIRRLTCKPTLLRVVRIFGTPSFYRSLRFNGVVCLRLPGGTSIKVMSSDEYGLHTEWFWKGIIGWEATSIAIWINLCRSGRLGNAPIILDIGACEGIYALTAKALCEQSRVLAFEPLPSAFQLLTQNIYLNGGDIDAVQAACSDSDGVAELFFNGDPSSTEATLVRNQLDQSDTVSCEVVVRKISSIATELGLTSIDLVKIDVEEAEPGVLTGMGELLGRCRPVIFTEVLSPAVGSELNKIIAPLDYIYWDINDDPRNGPLGIRRMAQVSKGICLNWLLVPNEKARLLEDCWDEFVLN
jgi:FkbM family methyltransferase